jgi:stress response protein YsnF
VAPTEMTVNECIGEKLVGTDGGRIGKITDVYMDDQTGQPEWFAVATGLFGSHVSFVPIQGTSWTEEGISVPFTKADVKDAPHAEPDGQLTQDEEAALYSHYGLSYSERRSASGLPEGDTPKAEKQARGDNAMTRSEEELVTGTRREPAQQVRLKKYVETEHVNITVPVKRERARLVTEPITDENRDEAMRGPDIRESTHEETLYEEEPVVGKRTVPKERVRLEKETVTDEREVAADLRKERIETEGDIEEKKR